MSCKTPHLPETKVQRTIKLQTGLRPQALCHAYQEVKDFISQNAISNVAIVDSEVSGQGQSIDSLRAAEFRGIVQAAAADVPGVKVVCVTIGHYNRAKKINGIKAKDLLSDIDFWKKECGDPLTIDKRKAAIAAVVARYEEQQEQ